MRLFCVPTALGKDHTEDSSLCVGYGPNKLFYSPKKQQFRFCVSLYKKVPVLLPWHNVSARCSGTAALSCSPGWPGSTTGTYPTRRTQGSGQLRRAETPEYCIIKFQLNSIFFIPKYMIKLSANVNDLSENMTKNFCKCRIYMESRLQQSGVFCRPLTGSIDQSFSPSIDKFIYLHVNIMLQ